jgi:hypothetical protein
VPDVRQQVEAQLTWKIIWPEFRTVEDWQIGQWYSDAVANGEATAGITDIKAMAMELHHIGVITLGK